MAKKRLIETAIWSDPWFNPLSKEAKSLFLFLLLNPNLSESGFIQILDKEINLHLELKDIDLAKKQLYPKVYFDPDHNLFLFRNYFRKNNRGKNHIKGAVNDLEKYQNSSLTTLFYEINQNIAAFAEVLPQEFINNLKEVSKKISYQNEREIETPCKGVGDSLQAPYKLSKIQNKNQTQIKNEIKIQNKRGIVKGENENVISIEPVNKIFEYWNQKKIIKHKSVNDYEKPIRKSIKDYGHHNIIQAIDNFHSVIESEATWWNHKYTLKEFLSRDNGLIKFLPENFEMASFANSRATGSKSSQVDVQREFEEDVKNGIF